MRSRWFSECVISLTTCFLVMAVSPGARAQSAVAGKPLTVERIYSQPSLSGRLTRGLTWKPDGKQVSFFETKGSGKEAKTELWVMDASTGERRMLVAADKLESILPAESAKETQATGLGRHAPSQYQWAPDGAGLLFQGATGLAWLDLKSQTARTLVAGQASVADAKISPDGRTVSFVRDHNVWLVNVADRKERALTVGGTEEIRKGELDWVYPEELEIKTAYWWSPDSSSIAYLEMDERKVSQYPMVDFSSPSGEADMERYPVAGGANPIVRIFVASLNGGEPREMDCGTETDIYVARVNWLPDSKRVAIQRLNRAQTTLDLLIADSQTGKTRTVLSETDPSWINVGDELHFLKNGERFVWSSERSGYRHLYLYDVEGKQLAQLTSGDWEVTSLDAVDEINGLVYFTATEKSPLERQVYRVGLDGSGFSHVTKDEGNHTAVLAPNASAFIDTYSNAATPPRQDLYRADAKPNTMYGSATIVKQKEREDPTARSSMKTKSQSWPTINSRRRRFSPYERMMACN